MKFLASCHLLKYNRAKHITHTKYRFILSKVESVIDKIIEEARTGEIGDGKIFCKISDFFFYIFVL